MKYLLYFLPLLISVSCSNAEHSHESEETTPHHHTDEITLMPETAKRFGVETSIVELGDFCETVTVSGEIYPEVNQEYTISATKNGIVNFLRGINIGSKIIKGEPVANISSNTVIGGDDDIKAKITLENAEREYKRMTALYEEKIITERDYIAAKEAFQQAQNAYKPQTSAPVSAVTGIVTSIYVNNGAYVEVGMPIATISAGNSLILRADLPERFGKLPITDANFKLQYATDTVYNVAALGGKLLSRGALTTSSAGYLPVYFKFNNDNNIITNSFAEVFLKGSVRHNVLSIPISALTEEQGDYFVYEKVDAECYVKHLISVGATDGYRIEVLSGIAPGMEIVTNGAIIVKLAANAGAVPGHSHEH